MRTTSLALMLTFLAACGDKEEADADGDGVESPADCDDSNADIKPGAIELCDGLDNDCDGQIDEGVAPLYYVDSDGDGAGDRDGTPTPLCAEEPGFAQNTDDCDDGDASVYVGATEDCTPIDRNCDGDPFGGATDLTEWFIDADGDGFGAPDASQTSCAQPANYVDNSDDCDDLRELVFPGAEEFCNGLDDDCNGTIDDGATDAEYLFADADADGYGDPTTGGQLCPGFGTVDNGDDCDDTNDQINPGQRDVCDGLDNDCDPTTSEDEASGAVYYADADGDGFGLTGGELRACEVPTGVVFAAGDCDDGDAAVNPDADELCDAVDRDCDGDPELGAVDADIYYADNDGDGVGAEYDSLQACSAPAGYLSTGGDCDDSDPYFTSYTVYPDADADGFGDASAVGIQGCAIAPYVLDATDCDDASPSNYPGAPELCDAGIDNDCDPLTDENLVAVWYEDADGDGFGDDGNTYMGCDPFGSSSLLNPTQVGGDCDDTDPDYNPIATPECIKEHCGTISGDEVWVDTVEHIVTCDVTVEGPDKPKLTIEDGAIVVFEADAGLDIGDGEAGSIDVQGFDVGVLFTSGEPVPQEGDYEGLLIGADAETSYVQGLTIEYAGSTGAGLTLEGEEVTVWESALLRNSGDGIQVNNGEPLIYDTMMMNNENNGLYVAANHGLSRLDKDGTTGPSFTGNYVAGNGGRPVTLPGSHADELDLSSELNDVYNANVRVEIELLSGTMRSTGTWFRHPVDPTGVVTTDGIPYYVAPSVTIKVEDGPQAHLTVANGVEAYFDLASDLVIGGGAAGRLTIGQGGPGGVLFTGTDNIVINGLNWDGIEFGTNDGGSVIDGLTIEYGGGNGKGNLYINGSAPTIRNSVIRYSDSNGVEVAGAAAAPEISFSDIVNNDENGVYVASGSGIARGGNSFAGNIITGNGESPVVMPPNFVGELDDTTTFAGNGERILVHGGTVLENAIWEKLDEDYQITGDIAVDGPQDPQLIIDPGNTFFMERGTEFSAGGDDGALIIDAIGQPVLFTSADANPGAGDWDGITIGDAGPVFQQSFLRGVTIDFAGGSNTPLTAGALTLSGGRTVYLEDININSSSRLGLNVASGASVEAHGVSVYFPYENTCFHIQGEVVDGSGSYPLDEQVGAWTSGACSAPGYVNPQPELGEIEVSAVNEVVTNTSFGASQSVTIPGGTVTGGQTLYLPSIASSYVVTDDLIVDPGGVLVIEAGVNVKFDAAAKLESSGDLVIEAAAALSGDTEWLGIDLNGGSVMITDASIDGAGLQGSGGITIDGVSGLIDGLSMFNTVGGCDIYDANRELDPYLGTVVCTPGETCPTIQNFSGPVCYP